MPGRASSLKRAIARLRAEPIVHFFLLGALLFALHRALVGNPRTIVVTPGLVAELARRFEDLHGRAPSAPELDAERRQWERDEAVYREALRQGLDRDDPAVRGALVAKILDVYGYVRGAPEQAIEVVNGIKLAMSLYAAIPFFICCVLLFFYEINKAMESRIEADLRARRAD